jgi:glycosyltransferase involved in cell wall biosynthesis
MYFCKKNFFMNILFLVSWYPTKYDTTYGIFKKEHAHAIRLSGNNIVVAGVIITKSSKFLSISFSNIVDENDILTQLYIITSRIKFIRNILYYALPLQYFLLKKIVKKLNKQGFTPEIIHSNVIYPMGILGDKLSKKLKIPHVITEHWTGIKRVINNLVLSKYVKKAYENAAKILPVSEYLENNIISFIPTLDKSKFKIVDNVINNNIFFYKEKIKKQNEITFCAVATWSYRRNPTKIPELFIEALSLFQKECNKKIHLIMIGGGNRLDELKELCIKSNLNASFLGPLDKITIAKYLQESDYFIHATTMETFGIVVYEALMCGTPVICSNVSPLNENINEMNGILCNNTIEDWLTGLRKLVNTTYNHKKIADDIKNKFSLKEISNAINSVYISVINEKNSLLLK